MVGQHSTTIISVILLSGIILSCASGPKDNEIIDLVKKERLGSAFLLNIKVEKKGGPRKIEGTNVTVFPVTVSYQYIIAGLQYGYVYGGGGKYFEPYYDDIEYSCVEEFLIGKNQFDEWDIVDSRSLEYKEVQRHRRPVSKSMEAYYGDRAIYKSR